MILQLASIIFGVAGTFLLVVPMLWEAESAAEVLTAIWNRLREPTLGSARFFGMLLVLLLVIPFLPVVLVTLLVPSLSDREKSEVIWKKVIEADEPKTRSRPHYVPPAIQLNSSGLPVYVPSHDMQRHRLIAAAPLEYLLIISFLFAIGTSFLFPELYNAFLGRMGAWGVFFFYALAGIVIPAIWLCAAFFLLMILYLLIEKIAVGLGSLANWVASGQPERLIGILGFVFLILSYALQFAALRP